MPDWVMNQICVTIHGKNEAGLGLVMRTCILITKNRGKGVPSFTHSEKGQIREGYILFNSHKEERCCREGFYGDLYKTPRYNKML